jgi:hypothetical protein
VIVMTSRIAICNFFSLRVSTSGEKPEYRPFSCTVLVG